MKKLFSFVVFLFVFALFQISPSQGQTQEPKELTEARNSYNAELQKAIKPVNDRYLPKLEELKKQLTFKGDIRGAVAVEDVITKMSGGQPLEQESDNDPQELKEIKKNYMVELETAIKPVRSLYLAKLEVLKQQLALSGALKAALAVEEEMEKIKAEQIYAPPKTTYDVKEKSYKVAVYRKWNATIKSHLYTTSATEGKNTGYADEGILGYIYPTQISGTIPVYRKWSARANDHLYTTSATEGSDAGYVDKGILGYVYPTQISGTIPVYRKYNVNLSDHFYTTSLDEGDNIGYVIEAILGYFIQNP